jgi:hypothetical protein
VQVGVGGLVEREAYAGRRLQAAFAEVVRQGGECALQPAGVLAGGDGPTGSRMFPMATDLDLGP